MRATCLLKLEEFRGRQIGCNAERVEAEGAGHRVGSPLVELEPLCGTSPDVTKLGRRHHNCTKGQDGQYLRDNRDRSARDLRGFTRQRNVVLATIPEAGRSRR